MESVKEILFARLDVVEARIVAACARAGRHRDDVRLVAITKSVGIATARAIFELGVRDLGESRPQELWEKAAAIPEARWHLVGHLQRNKIEPTLDVVHLIHSVDSLKLLEAIDKAATKKGKRVEVLLEVNGSREAKKQGFAIGEVPLLTDPISALKSVNVMGLMTMAAEDNPDRPARATFGTVAALREFLAATVDRDRHRIDDLSMGMSNDFEAAIGEGASLIRLGTVLFEGLE